MASIEATIDFLEKLPEDIRSNSERIAKECIERNGHVDTGNMLANTRAFAHGSDVQLVVWTKYARLVNDGHGGAVAAPGKWLQFKSSPKWPGPIYAKKTSGYGGSGFFDQAYVEILAYVHTL